MGWFTKAASPPVERDELARWMAERYDRAEYAAIWDHRLALGLGFGRAEASDRTWFWLNAYPALSALKVHGRGHPLIATCAGYADQVHRNLGPEERAANDEISRLFFGG